MRFLRAIIFVACLASSAVVAENSPVNGKPGIVWDATEKTVAPQPGDGAVDFIFKATNASAETITIYDAVPSCRCTSVDLPVTPWILAPGASGRLTATVDFSGKEGELTKSVLVESSAGAQTLMLHVKIPPPNEAMREANRKLAASNRQAVFHGECAACHVPPIDAKTGEDLFFTACAVCHASPNRASMVPDLRVARDHRDAAWWRTWISQGRDGSLMPAFAAKKGGPLTDAQVDSLVEFALSHLPTEPRKN